MVERLADKKNKPAMEMFLAHIDSAKELFDTAWMLF